MKKKIFIYLMTMVFILAIVSLAVKKTPVGAKSRPLTFYVATDIHYLSQSLTDNGKAFNAFVDSGDGKQLKYIDALTDAFVYEIKQKKPDFLIISGDLTNNGEKASHVDLAKKLAAIKLSGTKVFVIPGNHDVFNPYARGFKGDDQYKTPYISDKDFAKIYGDFGYNTALSRDSSSLSYLAAPTDKLWLLMLDTCKYDDNEVLGFPETGGRLKPATVEWIKKCSSMARTKGAKIITVMHHNLLDHFSMLSKDYTIDDNKNVIQLFQSNNLSIVLSGHIHIQDIKSTQSVDKISYDIATSALSVYPHHYGVMTYSPENGFHYRTSSVNVNTWASSTHKKDKILLNFTSYSRVKFIESAYNRSYNRLVASSNYTNKQISQMADTMAQVNLSIFSGTEGATSKKLLSSPGYKLWQAAKSSFLQSYIMNIANTKAIKDNNNLFVPISILKY